MGNVFVLAEHRQGSLREISLEMLTVASQVAKQNGGEAVAILLGNGVDSLAEKLAGYSDKVLYVDDPLFADYNSEKYQRALVELIKQNNPELFIIGHTTQGVDLAPALAVEMSMPFVSDVIEVGFADGKMQPVRQYYQGKVNANFVFKGEPPYLITLREATVEIPEPSKQGAIEKIESPLKEDIEYRRFINTLRPKWDVDIKFGRKF